MSTKVFEQAWERMGNGWPLDEIYREGLKRGMRAQFWFEWALARPGRELFERSEFFLQMCEDEDVWSEREPEEFAALIVKVKEGAPADSSRGYYWPRGSGVDADVGYMVRTIMQVVPCWLNMGLFEAHGDLQAVTDYIRWEKGALDLDELSDDVLAMLAYSWLIDEGFKALNEAPEFLTSGAWNGAVRGALSRVDSKQLVWSRAKAFQDAPDASRVLELAESFRLDVDEIERSEASVRELFEPHVEALPALLAAQVAESNDFFRNYAQHFMVLVLADMYAKREVTRPPALHKLVLECVEYTCRPALFPLLRGALHVHAEGVDEALERAAGRWFFNFALELTDFASSPQPIWRAVIAHAARDFKGHTHNGRGYVKNLGLIDDVFFCETLHALWKDEPLSRESALLMFNVLDAQQEAGAAVAEFYVLALEHKSKPVREHARKAILAIGARARPVLEAHKDAKKKAVRECCQEALAVLDSAKPGDVLSESELAVRGRKLERLELLEKRHDKLDAFMNEIMDDCMPWFEVMMEMYVSRPLEYQVQGMVSQCVTYVQQHQPQPAVWVAYVSALAQIDKKMRGMWKRMLIRTLATHMPDALLEEVFAPALSGRVGSLAEMLYTYYFERSSAPDIGVLIAGLQQTSKPARQVACDHATQMMAKASAEQASTLLTSLSPLLTSKQKHARELTARLFALATTEQLAPYVDVLTKARDKERSADALNAFDAVLSAAGQADDALEVNPGGEDASDASWSDAQALLESQRARKVPSFINLEALPDLCWAETGAPISEKALKGLLTTLRQEGPDSQDDVARRVRPCLDDASAHAFSIALKDQWMHTGSKPAHKWAPYQQGIFVTEERLNEFGPHLANWVSAGRHHWAKWYMDVLARHGSQTGKSWVVHWALNAEHRSLHEHATHLVEQLATQAGVTPGALRLSANLYIAQDAYEASFPTTLWEQEPKATLDGGEVIEFVLDARGEFMIKRANDKLQKSLPKGASADIKAQFKSLRDRVKHIDRAATRHLEECMISGRPWSKQAFETYCVQNPVIARLSDRLLFILEGGELFHIHEGDIIDVEWEPRILPEDQTIRIAHMFDLEGKNVDKWLAHMGEGDVVQPFAQLDRAFFKYGEEPEVGEVSLATLAGRLLDGGWRHAAAEDAGMVYEALKIWPGRGVRVTISHDGIYAGNPGMYRESTAVHISEFVDLMGTRIDPKDVDPIGYSETWVALCELTR